MPNLQQTVLFKGSVEKEAYGDHVIEVRFKQPVQISSISINLGRHSSPGEKTMFRGGWATDLFSAAAARYVTVLPVMAVPSQDVPALEAFATDHLVLHGKFHSVVLSIVGHALAAAAQQIKAEAVKQFDGDVPAANQVLSLPTSTSMAGLSGPPQLHLSPTPLLPLPKLPAVFVHALTSGVKYWRQVRLSHSRIESNPPNGRLDQLTALADAVLEAARGKPGALMAAISAVQASAEAAVTSSWSAVQDDALDMSASWCCMLASCRTHTPFDMEVGVAGLAASILLASCATTAAQFLSVTDDRQELAGAAAVRGVLSIPKAPPLISRYGLGLLELLLSSCPVVACSVLLGPLTPVLATSSQQTIKQDPEARHLQQNVAHSGVSGGVMEKQIKQEPHSSPLQRKGSTLSQGTASVDTGSHRKRRRESDAQQEGQPRSSVRRTSAGSTAGVQEVTQDVSLPAVGSDDVGLAADAAAGVDDGDDDEDGLYGGLDYGDTYDDVDVDEQQQDSAVDDPAGQQEAAGDDDGVYEDLHPEESEENLQLDADDDDMEENGPLDNEFHETVENNADQQENGPTLDGDHLEEEDLGQDGDTGNRDTNADHNIQADSGRQAVNEDHVPRDSTHDHAGYGLHRHGISIGQGDRSHQDTSNHKHQGRHERIQRGSGDRGRLGTSDGAGTVGRESELLWKRRSQAVKLYSGVVELALQPRREDIAASCAIVLNRIKAWECLTVLRSSLTPMLDGTVNAMLLPVQDFHQQMHKASMAVADLAAVVLLPTPAEPVFHSTSNNSNLPQSAGSRRPSSKQQADPCVLQLLLSCRVFELLAAMADIAAVHGSRLAEQQALDQQQDPPLHPDSPSGASHQLTSLFAQYSQLLASVQVLVSRLISSSAGWAYLRAAGTGLAALAQAINLDTQVSLDGGELNVNISRDPVSGRPQLRQQLLQGSHGSAADGNSSVAAELSCELQRLLLLAKAVGELQPQQADRDQQQSQSDGSARSSQAVQTLVQCCLSSGVGREAAVAALASCPPALQQLVLLMSARGTVLTAAAGQQQHEPATELAGLLDADDDPLSDGFGSSSVHVGSSAAVRVPQPPSYEFLYAPDLLLAVVSDAHPDIIQQWLPQADNIAAAVGEEVLVQDRHGSAAAAAAFPGGSGSAIDMSNKGLPLTAEAGANAALAERQKTVLLQLQGYAMTGRQLLNCWKQGDGSGSGTGSFLVTQLQQLLPPLVAVSADSSSSAAGALARTGSRDAADAVAGAPTSSSTTGADPVLQSAAAVAGAPPPWGKDVTSAAAAQFVNSPRDLSAALSALNITTMLLHGPSADVRKLVAALADQPAERAALKPALNPSVTLNPNGALGPGGSADGWAGGAAHQDGLSSEVLLRELLQGGVLDVLDRALRSATAALEGSGSDFMWGVRGGEPLDDLKRLQARSSAASLLLSASSAAAAMMLLLAEADVADLSGCSLLDAIICAHTAVVTSQEGLAATLPTPQLIPHLTAASTGKPTSPAAAATLSAAAARSGLGTCHTLLLSARHQLSVCLCCWQRCSWWPDSVGALLGAYPSASEVIRNIAAEEAEARSRGDRSAPPALAPRQGPRQMFAALLALGDICPPEWPAAGASQNIAAAAAAEGKSKSAAAFDRPSHVQLRSSIAASCEAHMSGLSHLVSWGAAADSKLVRAALLRLCVRAGSVGGGMSPFLVPLLLQVLREQLEAAIKAQQQLKAHIAKLAAAGQGAAAQQRALQAALPTTPQLSDSRRMIELLIPLASRPGFKTALLEHKVVGMLAKYLHKLAMRCKEEPDSHAAIGLVIQLMATLCNPDISLAPHLPREQREFEDTPLLRDARDMVAALLASAHMLDDDNMSAAASLLVGPCAAAGGRGLSQYSRGQAALRQGALRWFQSQAPDAASYMQGNIFIPEAIPASVSWAAGRLADVAEQSIDTARKASCEQIAAMLRQLPTALTPDMEADPAIKTSMRFAKAVQESVAAAPQSSASEHLRSLLDQPAVLLACDAVAAEFMAVCAVGAQTQRQKRFRAYGDKLASEASAMSSLFGGAGLLPPRRPRTQSRPVQWLQALVTHQGQPGYAGGGGGVVSTTPREDNTAQGADEVPEGVPVVPVIMAPRRSAAVFKHGDSSRKASTHVDDYEAQKQQYNPAAAPQLLPQPPATEPAMVPSGVLPLGRPGAGLPPPPVPPAAAAVAPAVLLGGPPFQGTGKVMRPGPRLPGAVMAAPTGVMGDGVGHWAGMAGQRSSPGGDQGAPGAAFHVKQQSRPIGAFDGVNAKQQQQQQAGRAPPSDPRQHRRSQQPQQQQQQLPPVTDLRRSESPDSGSGLLGGLAGESPDYAGQSPSYHSSPEGSGAGVDQEWPSIGQQHSEEDNGGYRVSEV